MIPRVEISRACLFLLFCTLTLPVDVGFRFMLGSVACDNLRPGECCRKRNFFFDSFSLGFPSLVTIGALADNEIAALWENPHGYESEACSGIPAKTFSGPGSFRVFAWDDPLAATIEDPLDHNYTGVSYVRLPTLSQLPPNLETSDWLAAEGMLGLAWNRYDWKSTRERVNTRPSKMKRTLSTLKGTAYIGPPPRWRFPDWITVNGTRYHSLNTSEPNYVP